MNYLEQISKLEIEIRKGLDSIDYDTVTKAEDVCLCNVTTLLREASDYINQILESQSSRKR